MHPCFSCGHHGIRRTSLAREALCMKEGGAGSISNDLPSRTQLSCTLLQQPAMPTPFGAAPYKRIWPADLNIP